MKNSIRYRSVMASVALAAVIAFVGCGDAGSPVTNTISGTYSNETRGLYAVAKDTLVIAATGSLNATHFTIERRTVYRAKRQGRLLPEKRRVQHLEAAWDKKLGGLMELITGEIFRFDERGNLLVGNAVYYRIN